MAKVTVADLAHLLEKLQLQMADMTKRLEVLEGGKAVVKPAVAAAPASAPPPPAEPEQPAIGEEELLAIAAAIGAFLGVKAHIRQIRLISTQAWAQQGRVSIQASHRLS
jgi:methylmalonyl-CoA carboxyltransferase large subunit